MSYPTRIDQAIIYKVTGTGPKVRTPVCGVENVTVNETVNTSDRFNRDCAKPGAIPTRTVRVNSRQWDVTGSGVGNADDIEPRRALLGISQAYEIDAIKRDGSDAGILLGTFAGTAVMTASNLSTAAEGDDGAEVTLAGEGELTWTPADDA